MQGWSRATTTAIVGIAYRRWYTHSGWQIRRGFVRVRCTSLHCGKTDCNSAASRRCRQSRSDEASLCHAGSGTPAAAERFNVDNCTSSYCKHRFAAAVDVALPVCHARERLCQLLAECAARHVPGLVRKRFELMVTKRCMRLLRMRGVNSGRAGRGVRWGNNYINGRVRPGRSNTAHTNSACNG